MQSRRHPYERQEHRHSPIEHGVGMTGHLSARNTRRGGNSLRQPGAGRQEKVACPIFLPAFAGKWKLLGSDSSAFAIRDDQIGVRHNMGVKVPSCAP